MTFAEIRQEVSDCGLDHLTTARLNRLVNLAHRRVQSRYDWPWRLTEQVGTPPLAVTRRGSLRQVLNSQGSAIGQSEEETIEAAGYNRATSGVAQTCYINSAGLVATYPVDTSITVRHYQRVAPLEAETDTPSIPDEEYHYLIVLDAVRRGKLENGEAEAAAQYANDYNELLADLKRDAFDLSVMGAKQLNDLNEGS